MRSHARIPSRLSCSSGRALALRCLLLVCAWQGPLPCWHCHCESAEASRHYSISHVEHLRCCHHERVGDSLDLLDWHIHLGNSIATCCDMHSATESDQDCLPLAKGLDSEFLSTLRDSGYSHLPSMPCCDDSERIFVLRREQSKRIDHFFDGFASSLPLPLRFCISRC